MIEETLEEPIENEPHEPTDPSVEPTDQEAERERALRLIEALLFASDRPMGDAELAARLPETLVLEELLDALRGHYRFRGINLVRAAGGWTFRTAPDLAGLLAHETVQARKLTRAQIETLAIIAYHQPVTRAEVEEIRGVTLAKGTLDLLMEAGWVMPKGRRETPGRPATWVTTEGFLLHFGLDSLRDLPNIDELKAAGLLDARPASTMGEGAPGDLSAEEGGYAGEEEDPL
jgi:segregation and condensation protein B